MDFKDRKTKLSLQNMFGYGAARGGGKPNFLQKKKSAERCVRAFYPRSDIEKIGICPLLPL